jgi:hypothetical protein
MDNPGTQVTERNSVDFAKQSFHCSSVTISN